MFKVKYSQLNKKQVEEVLSKRTAPVCASKPYGKLSGKSLKIITDKLPVEGPVLEYEFKSETVLLLKENGASAIECEYVALTMGAITLFSHMTGAKVGYTVIVNWDTTVTTVFEMWFIDHEGDVPDTSKRIPDIFELNRMPPFINREVQRQRYSGYFEKLGNEPVKKRDELTLSLENSQILWKDNLGRERLSTYTSQFFSTLVELGTPDGGHVMAFASDLLQANVSTYIYCHGEVEYSGRLVVEVFDIFTMEKIGVSFGIDESDCFEHFLYCGSGKFMGRLSTFYGFMDQGNRYSPRIEERVDYTVKGARATYRPTYMSKRITRAEFENASKNALRFSDEGSDQKTMASVNLMDESKQCVGKHLVIRSDDGFYTEYSFKSARELEYRLAGETEWHTEQYRSAQLDKDLVVLNHYIDNLNHPGCHFLALDFANGCATCIEGRLGFEENLHDVTPKYHFGVIEMEGIPAPSLLRHGFTTELLGRSLMWNFHENLTAMHIYNSPRSYSWTIMTNADPGSPSNQAGGFVWSSRCEYIKLREDVYIMNWLEENWEGIMGTAAMNLRIMKDCVSTFGILANGKGVFLDSLGARGRSAGKVDLSDVYKYRHSGN